MDGYQKKAIKRVIIPNGITTIANGAFKNCTKLSSVSIPDGITIIDNSAFYGCSRLTTVTIPNSVKIIGSSAFKNCSGLTSFVIPDSVTSIGSSAFAGCSGLIAITFPKSVTSIGGSAFYGCSGLTSITIPDNVLTVGSGAFMNCSNLTSIIWNVKNGNDYNIYESSPFFNDGPHITSFVFGDSVRHIPNYLCAGMEHFSSFTIPENVVSVGAYSFMYCPNLTTILWNAKDGEDYSSIQESPFYILRSKITSFAFGNSVRHIPDYLCAGMEHFTSFTIPENVVSVGANSFINCPNLTTILWNAKDGEDYSSNQESPLYILRSQLTSFAFGDSVKHIPAHLLANMSSFTSIPLPNSVTSIGEGAFAGCSGLTSITIPENVSSIGDGAFSGCSGLTSITIPENVSILGDFVFSGCSGLSSITLPNSITSIGDYAFNYCSGLSEFVIPNNVTSIGDYAFSNCSGLTSITTAEKVVSYGKKPFINCSNLTSIFWNVIWGQNYDTHAYGATPSPFIEIRNQITSFVFGNSVKYIPENLCAFMTQLSSITIPNNITNINMHAFDHCSNLNSITWDVEDGVTYYESNESPFYYIRGQITSFVFGDNVRRVPDFLCDGFSSLSSIIIPDNVIYIGSSAFSGCSNLSSVHITDLTSWCRVGFGNYNSNPVNYAHHLYLNGSEITHLTIPECITDICRFTFSNCTGLTSITIHDNVTRIGDYAFSGCSGLTSITIPKNVIGLGDFVFSHCYRLKTLFCEGLVPPTIGDSLFYWPLNAYYTRTPSIFVPCGSLDAYKTVWSSYADSIQYESSKIKGVSSVERIGQVKVPTTICEDSIVAIPTYGYHFVQWDDGNTDNPRFVDITIDSTYTAIFEINVYKVDFVDWDNSILDSQQVVHGGAAIAPNEPTRDGWVFVGWDKTFHLVEDNMTIHAQYEVISGIEEMNECNFRVRKLFDNGQLYILLPNGTRFDSTGQRVK